MFNHCLRMISQNPYKVLSVGRNATKEEIKKSYLSLVKIYHPDMPTGNEEMFKLVNEAFNIIINKEPFLKDQAKDVPQYEAKDMLWERNKKDFNASYESSSFNENSADLHIAEMTTLILTLSFLSWLILSNLKNKKDKTVS